VPPALFDEGLAASTDANEVVPAILVGDQ
jgi:hypothetical protein